MVENVRTQVHRRTTQPPLHCLGPCSWPLIQCAVSSKSGPTRRHIQVYSRRKTHRKQRLRLYSLRLFGIVGHTPPPSDAMEKLDSSCDHTVEFGSFLCGEEVSWMLQWSKERRKKRLWMSGVVLLTPSWDLRMDVFQDRDID
jgi:hypothetical protein